MIPDLPEEGEQPQLPEHVTSTSGVEALGAVYGLSVEYDEYLPGKHAVQLKLPFP